MHIILTPFGLPFLDNEPNFFLLFPSPCLLVPLPSSRALNSLTEKAAIYGAVGSFWRRKKRAIDAWRCVQSACRRSVFRAAQAYLCPRTNAFSLYAPVCLCGLRLPDSVCACVCDPPSAEQTVASSLAWLFSQPGRNRSHKPLSAARVKSKWVFCWRGWGAVMWQSSISVCYSHKSVWNPQIYAMFPSFGQDEQL